MSLELREFFQNLLKGPISPECLQIDKDILRYIKSNSKDIGYIYTIRLNLKMDVESISHRLFEPINHIDYTAEYDYKEDEKYEYTYEDFLNRRIVFITEDDRKKYDNEVNESFSNYHSLMNELLWNVLQQKCLTEFDIYSADAVLFNATYKLELITFKRTFFEKVYGEIKVEYYKYFLQNEIKNLKYNLEQYFEKKERVKHLSILEFFESKFSEAKQNTNNENLKECYQLIVDSVFELKSHLRGYFGSGELKSDPNDKLKWNAEIDDFVNFFDPLIRDGIILYKGEKNHEIIYKFLTKKIDFIKEIGTPETILNLIIKKLNLDHSSLDQYHDPDRLEFTRSRDDFAKRFIELIGPSPKKSKLLLNEYTDRDPIVRKLHQIFKIKGQRRPHGDIEENSLLTAFKNAEQPKRQDILKHLSH
jgi:hypothetical protein